MIAIKKKWRDFPKEEKLEIPTKIFNISEKEIKRIRKIKDPKTKLVESAKLQHKLFGGIHSYLTAWVAGYSSDVIVRQKFGSTQNLLNLFFKKRKYSKEINPSWSDIKRRIKIPKKINGNIAEETGIHIGDGNLYNANRKGKYKYYSYTITGDLKDEEEYHEKYLKDLLERIYNIKPTIIKRPTKNSIETRIKSKALIEFKKKILNLKPGNKKQIRIPKQIMENNKLSKRCAAGIIDTDFSITNSLAITGKLTSFYVVKQLAEIFSRNNVKFKLTKYKNYGRFYINKKGAIEIITKWKLNNLKHISKYECYQKFGNTFPNSKTKERMSLIKGKIKPEELLKLCKNRYAPRRT